jgi:hypothetical protein
METSRDRSDIYKLTTLKWHVARYPLETEGGSRYLFTLVHFSEKEIP